MTNNAPMTEHESALCAAFIVLGSAVIEMGGNKQLIQGGLSQAFFDSLEMGNKNGAATVALLAQALLLPVEQPGAPKPNH